MQRSAGRRGLLVLAEELPVHGDEQLLAVRPEARVTANRLDHVQAGLVIPADDRQVAQQPRQRAGLQLQGALQVGYLRRDGQRAAILPLRSRRLADPRGRAECAQRQAPSGAGLLEDPAELLLLRVVRHACSLSVSLTGRGSIAYGTAGPATLLDRPCASLDESYSMLYDRFVLLHRPESRHG